MDNSVIVLIAIVGAGGVVLLGFAFTNHWVKRSPESFEAMNNQFSQEQYMREVRLRNQDLIAAQYGWSRPQQ